MSNTRFFFNNLLDLATLAASSEDPEFPASNLQHPLRTKVWTTAGSPAGTANLVIDHGSSKAVTAIILANYSWASAPGTLDLEFNDTDSWGSPAATEPLTWVATPDIYGNRNVIVKCFSSKAYRYNRLNVVYAPGDWDLGRSFIGTYFETEHSYDYDGEEQPVDPSYIDDAVEGPEHVDEIEKYRTKSFVYSAETESQWRLFQQLMNTVGFGQDIFIAFNYDGYPNELTMYGKLKKFGSTERRLRRIEMAFKESR